MGKILFFIAFIALLAVVLLFLIIPRKPAQELAKANLDVDGHILHVEIADTMATRAQGLSGRERLAEDEGMYFIFPIPAIYPFWMKDMKFPIDIIWIRGEKIVGITENAAVPDSSSGLPIYSPPTIIDKVLEVDAGLAGKLGLAEGKMVKLVQ